MRFCTFLFAALALVLTACGGAEANEDGRLRVVATTSMIADLVEEVGGEDVVVDGLMGPGVDPHLYQASESDVGAMAGADFVVYNGLHLEGKMTDLFEQMDAYGTPTLALAEEAVEAAKLIGAADYASNYDPHVWLDVSLWQQAAQTLGAALAEQDPEHAEAYRERADAYAQRLDSLHAYAQERLAAIPDDHRVLVTSHDAFGYFGQAYGMDVRGLQGISTAAEAGTADVQSLARFVAERRLPALFVESSVSPRGIEAVREAVRARGHDVALGGTLYGDALGPAGSDADSYVGMVRHNVETLAGALAPAAS